MWPPSVPRMRRARLTVRPTPVAVEEEDVGKRLPHREGTHARPDSGTWADVYAAYAGYAEEGDDRSAAWMSARLCIEHFIVGQPAVGAGWLGRTQRHARALSDGVEHGFLALLEAIVARFSGDLDASHMLAQRAVEVAHRFGERDLLGMAIHTEGLLLVAEAASTRAWHCSTRR